MGNFENFSEKLEKSSKIRLPALFSPNSRKTEISGFCPARKTSPRKGTPGRESRHRISGSGSVAGRKFRPGADPASSPPSWKCVILSVTDMERTKFLPDRSCGSFDAAAFLMRADRVNAGQHVQVQRSVRHCLGPGWKGKLSGCRTIDERRPRQQSTDVFCERKA